MRIGVGVKSALSHPISAPQSPPSSSSVPYFCSFGSTMNFLQENKFPFPSISAWCQLFGWALTFTIPALLLCARDSCVLVSTMHRDDVCLAKLCIKLGMSAIGGGIKLCLPRWPLLLYHGKGSICAKPLVFFSKFVKRVALPALVGFHLPE